MWKKLLRVVWKRSVITPLRSAEEGDLAKSLLRRKPLLLVSIMPSLLTLLDELRYAPQRRLGRHAPPLLLVIQVMVSYVPFHFLLSVVPL